MKPDSKQVDRNIAEANEMYRAGVVPDHNDLRRMQTGSERMQRDKDMKQFVKSSGESGSDPYWTVSDAYREGYERIDWTGPRLDIRAKR